MGINQHTFKNKINPNMDTHHIYPEEIDLIATIVNTDEIAQYFAEQRGLMCIKKTDFHGLSDSSNLTYFLHCRKSRVLGQKESVMRLVMVRFIGMSYMIFAKNTTLLY